MRYVLLNTCCIDHDKNMIPTVGEHNIIFNAASAICEKPISLATLFQGFYVHRDKFFELFWQFCVALGAQDNLPHMANIKKACLSSTYENLNVWSFLAPQ